MFVAHIVWSCDFEDGSGVANMCGIEQSIDDHFDWNLNSGTTLSKHTGPTHAKSGIYYAYIEASNPRVSGDTAE